MGLFFAFLIAVILKKPLLLVQLNYNFSVV